MGNTWKKQGHKMKPWLQTRFEYGSKVTGKDFLSAMAEMENWNTVRSLYPTFEGNFIRSPTQLF